jgi:hypothetical protein
MKKLWATVLLIAVAAGLFLLLRSKNPPPENTGTQTGGISGKGSNHSTTQVAPQSGPAISPPGAAENASAPNSLASRAASPNSAADSTPAPQAEAALPPATVLDKARVVMNNYRATFGENPVGTNPEITAALRGKNVKQINFVADSGLRVNEKGEMVDAYGTPFFFHQISGQEMEIRSAGADRVMWTSDDLVTK